jgi:hypothetical protein
MEHVAHMREMCNAYKFVSEKLKGRDCLGELV